MIVIILKTKMHLKKLNGKDRKEILQPQNAHCASNDLQCLSALQNNY